MAARLGFAVVLATMGLVAPAATAFAAGTTTPQDVVDAFTDATSAGSTLTLDQNVKVVQTLTLATGDQLTINLSGHTLTVIGTVGSDGTDGSFGGGADGRGGDGGDGAVGIGNSGTLVIENGTLSVVGGNGGIGGAGAVGDRGPAGDATSPDGLGGTTGGAGGNAGSGGVGVDNHSGATIILSGVTATLQGGGGAPGGFGGNGGQGGSGYDAASDPTAADGTAGGDGGPGGDGGASGSGGSAGVTLANAGTLATIAGSMDEQPGVAGPAGGHGDGGAGGTAGAGKTGGTDGSVGTDGAAGADDGTGGSSAQLFTGHTASVTLDGNGAAAPETATAYAATVGDAIGALAALPSGVSWPTLSGSTLSGWNTAADGSGDPVTESSTSTSGPVYAQWTPSAQTCAAAFQQAFNDATGGTVTLTCDPTITADDNMPLTVKDGASITLDLNGHALTVTGATSKAGIAVPAGTSLTIDDSSSPSAGKLIAQGGEFAAGIGGNDSKPAGAVTIESGTVKATGGASAAGIGGGQNEPADSVTITGGTVTATSDGGAAGIGNGLSSGGGTVTISGGHVTAVGGTFAAGIGSGSYSTGGGTVTISGGTVAATGGPSGAGIGGGRAGAGTGGTVTISGEHGAANVTATGGNYAAGIGGGAGFAGGAGYAGGAGGTVHIGSGATVTAVGGSETRSGNGEGGGPGIGGGGGDGAGNGGDGASLTIDAGATVTVSSVDESTSAIGGGGSIGGSVGAFGSLANAGTLTIPSGNQVTIPSNDTVTNTGTIANAGTITGSGALGGTGTVNNSGAIWHTVSVGSDQKVTDHHYQLTFDTSGGGQTNWPQGTPAWSIVDGPTLQSVGRATSDLPTASRQGYTFEGWNSQADGNGTIVTDTTTFPGSSSGGTPVGITLYAQWTTNGPATWHAYPNGGASQPTSCPVVTDLADACTLTQALALADSGDTVVLEADPGANGTATFTTKSEWTVAQDSLTIKPADGVDPTLDGQHQAVSVLNYTGEGTLTVTGLTVANSAGSTDTSTPGGGIVNGDGTLHVTNSTFTGNNVDHLNGYGGGILNWSAGTVAVTSSTFAGNDVTAGGYAMGGGLVNISQGTARVISSTFANNTVDGGNGGGITSGDGPVTVIASTITGNTASSGHAHGVSGSDVTLAATLLGGNGPDCDAPVTDAGYNISSDDSCGFTKAGSVGGSAGIAVTLNRLADNGGPTKTMMPFDVSAAVGMIPIGTSVTVGSDDVTLCSTTDQRGTSSAQGEPCNGGSVQGSVTADCSTAAGFAAIFDAATDGDTVTLCSDITITAAENLPLILASGESVTLDLNGHSLDVTAAGVHAGIGVPTSTTLTVTDASQSADGTLTVTGGDNNGSGIGGDNDHRAAGTVRIDGGTVTASGGGSFGSGIGAPNTAADLTIGAHADVTVSGGTGIALGSFGGVGTVTNAGALTLPAGQSISLAGGTITNNGTINNAGTVAAGPVGGNATGPAPTGTLTGTGTINNAGAIGYRVTIGPDLTVTDHHYALHFDANGGSLDWAGATPWSVVDGPSLKSVYRSASGLPGVTRNGYRFTGWYLASDASGSPVGDTTTLSSDSATGGAAFAVTLYAGWAKTKSLHAYPHGRANAPTSCPVVTDLTEACTLGQALGLASDSDTVILEADPGTGSDATFTTTTGWDVPQESLTIRPASGIHATLDGGHTAPHLLNYTGTGTLTVTGLTVANSVGHGVTAGAGTIRPGGGIIVAGGGNLHVTDSTFAGNTATGQQSVFTVGGGIVNIDVRSGNSTFTGGAIVVENSTFTGNTTTSAKYGLATLGGGIETFGGTVTVAGSTFDGNTVTASPGANKVMGGGIVNGSVLVGSLDAMTVAVTSSTFTGNTVTNDGGGNAIGGAIVAATGHGTVVASTFAGNTVVTEGAQQGITYGGALVAVRDATVAASVFAGQGTACGVGTASGGFTDAGYNISDDSSCGFTSSTSVNGAAGLASTLNALADNGGPTETIAPKSDSPVLGMITAGTSVTIGGKSVTLCPTTDQRGVASAGGEACNAGSVQSAGPLTITTDSLPGGTVGTSYGSHTLAATGGIGGYTWTVADGALPDGLTLSDGGVISGTPHVAGTAHVTVQVTDNAGFTDTRALSVTIAAAPPGLTVETADLPAGTVGSAYRQVLHASGAADGVYHWSIAAGSLPDGLHLSDSGLIFGTPSKAGTFAFTVSVNDPATADLTITIDPAATPTTTVPTTPASTSPSTPSSSRTAIVPPTVTVPTPSTSVTTIAGSLPMTGTPSWTVPAGLAAIVLILGGALVLVAGSRRQRRQH